VGATPAGAALLSALFALVVLKAMVYHVMPSATVQFAKRGNTMKRVKVLFASTLETFHGLGVSGLASCLLTEEFLISNKSPGTNARIQ